MKTNHDGTITLNVYDNWTSCVACGQRVTGDSIHTCSPQLKKQDTDCQYCKQGCIRCDARKQLIDEEIDDIENAIYCKTIQKGKTQNEYIKTFARAILKKAQNG